MPHIEIAAEKLFEILGLPITNTLVMGWIVVGVLTALAFLIFKRISVLPSTPQNIFEFFIESFLNLMEGVFGSRAKAEKYLPIVATIFIFILISNWLGIFPGIGSVGFFEEKDGEKLLIPFFRSPASDLNFTLAMALIAVFLVNILGVTAIGFFKHISRFLSFKGPLDFFVGILEFISEIAKMVSFSFRLFGNVFAGEVLLIITAFLVPVLVPVPFLLLEIFVGFIQALVFAMLTTVFIGIAVSHH